MNEYTICGLTVKARSYNEAVFWANRTFKDILANAIDALVDPDSTASFDDIWELMDTAIKGWQETKHEMNAETNSPI